MQKRCLRVIANPFRRIEFVLCSILVLLSAGAAHAQGLPLDPEKIKALAAAAYKEGNALIRAGRLREGCPLIEKSLKLATTYNAQIRLAECLSRLGSPGYAARFLSVTRSSIARQRASLAADGKEAIRLSKLDQEAATLAEAILPQLAELPRIELTLSDVVKSTPGLTISLDDLAVDVEAAREGIPVDPVRHEIKLEAPTKEAHTLRVNVATATQEIIWTRPLKDQTPPPTGTESSATVVPPSTLPPKPVVAPESAREPPSTGIGPRTIIGTGFVIGVAGLAVGIGYGVAFLKGRDDYMSRCADHPYVCLGRENQQVHDETQSLLLPEAIGFAVGGVGFGVAGLAALLLSTPRSSTGLQIYPVVSRNQAAIGFTGHF